MMENVMSTITYPTPFEYEQELIEFCKTIDNSDAEYHSVPSIRMTAEMKQKQRLLHLGKKRSKQSCHNISKSKTLGNHHLAKSYILTSPTGEIVIVPKGEMNVIAKKFGLNPNMLRHNATKIRKNGSPFKHRKWITQLV